jgi:transposase
MSYFEHSVNCDKFMLFLEGLASTTEVKGATLFLDNLRLHHSHRVRDWARENGARLMFNAAYLSPYNPIEFLWGFSKRKFYVDEALVRKGWTYRQV